MQKESQQKYEMDSLGTWTNIDESQNLKSRPYKNDNEGVVTSEKDRMNRSGKVKDGIIESD